jgi:surface protein
MPKLDLTRLDRLKMAGGEVAAIKGAGFDWARPITVTRAQLDTAIDGGTFAIVDSGITYTLADSTFNVDVSDVTYMASLFFNSTFNGNINYWNVSNVTNVAYMFQNATAFNQSLDNWNVSNVTDMRFMFQNATAFNQSLDNWNVSNVTFMFGMFQGATSFNQPLDNWNVSNVTNMFNMFWGAIVFNQPLANWNVSNVTFMSNMFQNATSFNQTLDNWNVSNVTDMGSMFSSSGLTPENYSRTLIGWANRAYNGGLNDGVQPNVALGAVGCQYNTTTYTDAWPNLTGQQFTDAGSARTYLVNTMGWTITDGGQT